MSKKRKTAKTKTRYTETPRLDTTKTNRKNTGKIRVTPWESLTLADDFIFGKVMQKPELCQTLLQYIFPEMKIEKIQYLELQKSIENDREAHGVRLDVYVRDSKDRVFNMEMQKKTKPELPKRSRYYQSMTDLQNLNRGQPYKMLKKSFVIFICLEDMFGEKRHIYTFEYACRQDRNILLKDDATKVFLNAAGEQDDVNQDLKAFLDYLRGIPSDHPFVKTLDQAVKEVKMNRKWRREYMLLALRDMDNREEGREEGKRESLLEVLKTKWGLPEELRREIMKQKDYSVLSRWFTLAITESTLKSFREKMHEKQK